jgi:hypothetical protein
MNPLLRFDGIDETQEPSTEETAHRGCSSSSVSGISPKKTLCEAEQCKIYKCM